MTHFGNLTGWFISTSRPMELDEQDDAFEKASFGGDRSAAGRYAAQQRWKNHKKDDAPVSWDTPTDDLEVAKATGRPISWLQYGSFPKEVQDIFDTKMVEFRDITEEIEVKRKWFKDNNLRINDSLSEDHPLRNEYEKRNLEWRELLNRKNKNQSDMRAEAYKAGFDYAIKAGMINIEAEMCARSMYRNFVVHNYDVFNQDASSHEDRLGDAMNSVGDSPEVMVATPIEVVEKMIRGDKRFKSQFETGGSRGSYSPDGRAEQEAFAFGLHPSVNEKLRPIYGYIRKGTASYKEIIRGEVRQYGEVHFVLKPKVLDRTTFTTDDSLSQPMSPAPVRKPTYLAGHPIQRYEKRYTEAQIHGGVSLDDVAKVVMPRQAAKAMIDFPTLRISLQKMGIPLELV